MNRRLSRRYPRIQIYLTALRIAIHLAASRPEQPSLTHYLSVGLVKNHIVLSAVTAAAAPVLSRIFYTHKTAVTQELTYRTAVNSSIVTKEPRQLLENVLAPARPRIYLISIGCICHWLIACPEICRVIISKTRGNLFKLLIAERFVKTQIIGPVILRHLHLVEHSRAFLQLKQLSVHRREHITHLLSVGDELLFAALTQAHKLHVKIRQPVGDVLSGSHLPVQYPARHRRVTLLSQRAAAMRVNLAPVVKHTSSARRTRISAPDALNLSHIGAPAIRLSTLALAHVTVVECVKVRTAAMPHTHLTQDVLVHLLALGKAGRITVLAAVQRLLYRAHNVGIRTALGLA